MNLLRIVWLDFNYQNKHYEGEAIPLYYQLSNCQVPAFDIYFDNEYNGTLIKENSNWMHSDHIDDDIAKIISNKLFSVIAEGFINES